MCLARSKAGPDAAVVWLLVLLLLVLLPVLLLVLLPVLLVVLAALVLHLGQAQ